MICSIVIPTFNYAKHITQAIQSVLLQRVDETTLEIIVIDDGSNDDTAQVLQSFIQSGQIEYHYQQNQGKAAATRKAIALASGDIIFNLDADDYFLPGKIAGTVALFEQYPQLVHVANPASIVYEDGKPPVVEPIPASLLGRKLEGPSLLRHFFQQNMLFGGGSTFAARASVLKSMRWSDAVDMYTDEWLLIETLLKGASYFLPQPFTVWRVHDSNYSGSAAAGCIEKKQARMLASSEAIVQLLETGSYPTWLKKHYRLKHEVRKMLWLEASGHKRMHDILRFFQKGLLSGNSVPLLWKYHAFQRLLPTAWLNALKT